MVETPIEIDEEAAEWVAKLNGENVSEILDIHEKECPDHDIHVEPLIRHQKYGVLFAAEERRTDQHLLVNVSVNKDIVFSTTIVKGS